MDYKSNFKTGYRDIVDTLMFIVIVVVAILDLFTGIPLTGGYALCAVYASSCIYRMGFYKNALNKYVTDEGHRRTLLLPKKKQ